MHIIFKPLPLQKKKKKNNHGTKETNPLFPSLKKKKNACIQLDLSACYCVITIAYCPHFS